MNPVALIKALRPKQWVKNGLLVVALVFSKSYSDPALILKVALGIAFFCMLSSSGYLVNDLKDIEADRQHPQKKSRPIAAGDIPVPVAWAAAVALLVGGLLGSWFVGPRFFISAVAYLAITYTYSFVVKHQPVLDVMGIAAGFMVRAIAGAEAIEVESSGWFIVCIGFGALFIGLCKRLAELRLLEAGAGSHRKTLNDYTEPLLNQLVGIAATCSLISYALYTFEGPGGRGMMATVPIVVYAVLRYLLLVGTGHAGGEPSSTLLRDRPLQVSMLLFGATILAIQQLPA